MLTIVKVNYLFIKVGPGLFRYVEVDDFHGLTRLHKRDTYNVL